ncbi:hypothetical protein SNE40_015410 [Patella caerulea]|uniref:Asteroid domain-containing protein n=1 Tax=Patella caerulea TaxID=87958 RepID=A0AAN8PS05_PATCE
MGISYLLTYCLNEENGCKEEVDLVRVARERNGIEILVDYYNFLHNIRQKFAESLCENSGNEYLRLCGAEYATFDKYVCNILKNLNFANIRLRFYIDGAKGSCKEQKRRKLDTWIKRDQKDVDKLNRVLNVSCGYDHIYNLRKDDGFRPVLIELQMIESIKSCGCDIVQIPIGEADHVIAIDFVEREKAFAVLSSDSDFCIFKNCKFIPDKLFDMENDLHLDQIINPFSTQSLPKLVCGMVTNERVVHSLGFSSSNDLIEMSILAGNDFTAPTLLANGLASQINCRSIEEYADVIRRYRKVENLRDFAYAMSHDHSFTKAVEYSRDFYLLRIEKLPASSKGYFTKLIEERIIEQKYPPHLMAMHFNFYWRRLILEDTHPGQPCAEIALETLRSCIYHMILPQNIQTVTEYGRTPDRKVDSYQVKAINDGTIPRINNINPSKIFVNLRTFHYIMTHQEPGSIETIWTDKYGRKNGFKYLMLRYFLLLNWKKNLWVSEAEFLGLTALVYGGHTKESEYQRIPICPSPRCFTLVNWLECIYRTMYMFIGKLLFISHEFPSAKELFSGSVWTVFYVCSDQRAWHQEIRKNYGQLLHQAKREMNAIIKEKRHIIKHIAEGCFYFDDRW